MPAQNCKLIVSQAGKPDREFPLGDSFTIGRDPTCNLQLADQSVSRIHATIVVDRATGSHILRDGSFNPPRPSSNGTFVNQQNRLKGSVLMLKHGDVITIAAFNLTYLCQTKDTVDPSKQTYSGAGNES